MKNHYSTKKLLTFITKFHLLIGILVGPFIFIATLTGALYAITPSLENYLYKDLLTINERSKKEALSKQVEKAILHINKDEYTLFSVRPSSTPTTSTRVLFTSKNLRSSEYQTIFINPYSLDILGEELTYGTSGVLPLRMKIDYFHRDLYLQEYGRWYSELAASWMWVTAFTGLIIFFHGIRKLEILNSHHLEN